MGAARMSGGVGVSVTTLPEVAFVSALDLDALIATIRSLAIEYEHRTSGSQYFDIEWVPDDSGEATDEIAAIEPCCIVGHALWRLRDRDALIDAQLADTDCSFYGLHASSRHLDDDDRTIVSKFPDRRVAWIDTVQRRQDEGASWGDAVRAADELLSLAVTS